MKKIIWTTAVAAALFAFSALASAVTVDDCRKAGMEDFKELRRLKNVKEGIEAPRKVDGVDEIVTYKLLNELAEKLSKKTDACMKEVK